MPAATGAARLPRMILLVFCLVACIGSFIIGGVIKGR
jgi:hypothetical protein